MTSALIQTKSAALTTVLIFSGFPQCLRVLQWWERCAREQVSSKHEQGEGGQINLKMFLQHQTLKAAEQNRRRSLRFQDCTNWNALNFVHFGFLLDPWGAWNKETIYIHFVKVNQHDSKVQFRSLYYGHISGSAWLEEMCVSKWLDAVRFTNRPTSHLTAPNVTPPPSTSRILTVMIWSGCKIPGSQGRNWHKDGISLGNKTRKKQVFWTRFYSPECVCACVCHYVGLRDKQFAPFTKCPAFIGTAAYSEFHSWVSFFFLFNFFKAWQELNLTVIRLISPFRCRLLSGRQEQRDSPTSVYSSPKQKAFHRPVIPSLRPCTQRRRRSQTRKARL